MKMEPVKSFESDRSFVDLSKPSLRALSYVLRHKELWKEGFVWGYNSCESCAIGLAVELWEEVEIGWRHGIADNGSTTPEIMAKIFPINEIVAEDIFCRAGRVRRIFTHEVTPEMVADDIDRYLEKELI